MLKDFIQWLLNTRTTPAEAAHSARSLFSAPITFSGKTSAGEVWTDNLVTGISPKDGYLNISASTVNSENFGTMLQVTSNEVQLSQVSSTSGQGLNFLLPITKGAQFSVNGIRAKDIAVRFFESLGGGYNCLIKEVQLCLRTSYSSCLKLLSRVKRLGLANSPTYRIRQLTTQSPASPHSQTEKVHLTKHIRHQMTAGLLADIGLYRHYLCQTFQNLKLVVEKLGEKIPTKTCEFSSLVVKGIVYGCGLELLRQKEQPDFLGSFPRLELFNLAKGGLPC